MGGGLALTLPEAAWAHGGPQLQGLGLLLTGYDKGTTAGLICGALTQTAVLGTATAAINHLAVSAEEKATLLHHMSVAYAVTYVSSTALVAWWLASIGPKQEPALVQHPEAW